MLDTAVSEIHSPDAWENFLSTIPEWARLNREEQASLQITAPRKSDWRGRVLVLSAAVSSSALVALFVWTVL